MYNFEKYAIKCDNWQQMEQLAEIARGKDLTVVELDEIEIAPYFRKTRNGNYYSNYDSAGGNPEISFADFMATGEHFAAFRTSVLTHLPTGDIQAFAASPDGEKILADMYLPFEYSQDDLRVVAEKVIEAFELQNCKA